MREALEEWESGINIGGRMVTNLRRYNTARCDQGRLDKTCGKS